MPRSQFQQHFAVMELSIQECVYAHCAWVFVGHFLNRLGSEYQSLQSLLDPENSAHQEILSKLKKRLRDETFTRQLIFEIMTTYPSLLKLLYLNFAWTHYIPTSTSGSQDIGPTLSFQRLQTETRASEKDIYNEIQRQCQSADHVLVMSSIMVFNQSVLKTNFYQPTKVAISFRLNPGFLSKWEYPISLYGMFLVIGSEFRGFHLRFRDVARGGIRIVKSRSKEAYALNARTLFDENYNLASTQQRKNKDIPEGGAKGILLDIDQQDQPTIAFEKYIDSILDLLLPGHSPGIKDQIVDLHCQDEILFLGPDENTAHLVDWATEHARIRGAKWWKSFFTGKSMSLGGIPHDKFGMTTKSVRAFVEGIYKKLGLKEEDVTKMQTGGPDGDLGSSTPPLFLCGANWKTRFWQERRSIRRLLMGPGLL
jgi:glutamate dehydrogenase